MWGLKQHCHKDVKRCREMIFSVSLIIIGRSSHVTTRLFTFAGKLCIQIVITRLFTFASKLCIQILYPVMV